MKMAFEVESLYRDMLGYRMRIFEVDGFKSAIKCMMFTVTREVVWIQADHFGERRADKFLIKYGVFKQL